MFIKPNYRPEGRKENLICGCKLLKRSGETMDFPFCSDVVYLDAHNQIGMEFNWGNRIRIDGIVTSSEGQFFQMMEAVETIGRRFAYRELFFADQIEDGVAEMLLDYGFEEIRVLGDSFNRYFEMRLEDLKGGKADDIR